MTSQPSSVWTSLPSEAPVLRSFPTHVHSRSASCVVEETKGAPVRPSVRAQLNPRQPRRQRQAQRAPARSPALRRRDAAPAEDRRRACGWAGGCNCISVLRVLKVPTRIGGNCLVNQEGKLLFHVLGKAFGNSCRGRGVAQQQGARGRRVSPVRGGGQAPRGWGAESVSCPRDSGSWLLSPLAEGRDNPSGCCSVTDILAESPPKCPEYSDAGYTSPICHRLADPS